MEKPSERPQLVVPKKHPIADLQFIITGETLYDAGFVEFKGHYPSRGQHFKMLFRYFLSLISWPLRWLVIHAVTPIIERAFERKAFAHATGLNPLLFKPENVKISCDHGFQLQDGGMTKWVPLPEAIRAGTEFSIREFLLGKDSKSDHNLKIMDAELEAVTALVERVESFTSSFKLMHTAYYRSEYVIQDIAYTVSRDHSLKFRKLINWVEMSTSSDGRLRTVVVQPNGEKVQYEFQSKQAKLHKENSAP